MRLFFIYMALEKINNPMRDDMYFSKKTGKYKVDLSRFGVKGKVEDKHPTPAIKSARRKSLSAKSKALRA